MKRLGLFLGAYVAHWLGFIFSSLPNVILGGHQNQSLSARTYEAAVLMGLKRWKPVMAVIDFILADPEHCMKAYRKEFYGGKCLTYDPDAYTAPVPLPKL